MDKFPPLLDLNRLKEEQNITDDAITASGFTPDDLQEIYSDYCFRRWDALTQLKDQFLTDYILPASNSGIGIHSFNGRVKDPYHLIEKVIRKRINNKGKYGNMLASDYHKYITDMIGCRILLAYKKNWESVHDYLVSHFPDEPAQYINEKDYAASYDAAPRGKAFMAEQPVAHMRLGDAEIYPKGMAVKRNRYYRSLHYIIRFETYYVELQVRTLFEEAWGEVDHDILYPYFKDNDMLVGFSTLINRIAGTGDEMSAYMKDVLSPTISHKSSVLLDVPISTSQNFFTSAPLPPGSDHMDSPALSQPAFSTAEDVLNSILY